MEARIETIEETLHRLVQHITQNERGNQPRQPQHPYDDQEDRMMRFDIKDFDGHSSNPEEHLVWEASMDRYFEYRETTPERQYKIAKMKLTKLAALWLEGIQRQRLREHRDRIDT